MLIKCTFLWLIQLINCQRDMEPFIVGGHDAKIELYPHSVYMSSSCRENGFTTHWRCGSSILNQWILLSAAHCFQCKTTQQILFAVGSSSIKGIFRTSADTFISHPKYVVTSQSNDIALAKVKTRLPLGKTVSRVALVRNPPYNELAAVAGWGVMDEEMNYVSNVLKFIRQRVLSYSQCIDVLKRIPQGCLCAGDRHSTSYASSGDSGSALVVRGFIQIGVVSFRKPHRSNSITVYTDTGYFYDWIISTAKSLYCQ